MKKIIIITAILIIIALAVCFTGCTTTKIDRIENNNASMFVIVEETVNYQIVYHKETLVMYAVSYGSYNRGTFTLLVNADGTPMLYEENK